MYYSRKFIVPPYASTIPWDSIPLPPLTYEQLTSEQYVLNEFTFFVEKLVISFLLIIERRSVTHHLPDHVGVC